MSEPYYSDDHVTLYLGDCREVTEWLAADVLVTDPPYGIGGALSMSGGKRGYTTPHGEFGRQDWDTDLAARDAALALWGERPYAVFGSPRRLDAAPAHRQVPLIWDKGDTVGMGDTTFPWRPTYEVIYVNGAGWSGYRGVSVLRYRHLASDARAAGHPTPKPLGLMAEIITKAPPGVIADPFAGSGSTLLAAKTEGRSAIGVELEERYAEAAARRLAQDTLPLEAM